MCVLIFSANLSETSLILTIIQRDTRRVKKKDRTFAIKTLLVILQHFKHCPHRTNRRQLNEFPWNFILDNFRKSVEKVEFLLKSDKKDPYFT